MHKHNLAYLVKCYGDEVERYMRAQITSFANGTHFTADTLLRLAGKASRYATIWGLPDPKIDVDASLIALQARIDRLRNDPKRAAKIAAREALRERKRLEQAKLDAERNAYRIEQFRLGAPINGYLSDDTGGAMLRISRDENSIQTSWGAEAPISNVIYALQVYAHVMEANVAPWTPGTSPIKLGHFTLDRINADGSVKAGCHVISAKEIALLRDDIGYLAANIARLEVARMKL
jgi:hypothetical protein